MLGLVVHERQRVDEEMEDGRGLLLALHAHQLQEVLSVWEGMENHLSSLAEEPGVVGGQSHPVGVPGGRTRSSRLLGVKALACLRNAFPGSDLFLLPCLIPDLLCQPTC